MICFMYVGWLCSLRDTHNLERILYLNLTQQEPTDGCERKNLSVPFFVAEMTTDNTGSAH